MSAEFDRALFLYGFDVDGTNQFINFRAASMGPILTAVLNIGNYTATEYLAEIQRAMQVADPANTYTPFLDRTINSGKSNLLHLTTSGSYLDILFGTGPNAGNSPAATWGWNTTDFIGATTYVGYTNAGIILFPDFPMYNYQGPEDVITADGAKNVSAFGIKETLVFAQVQFVKAEWMWITDFGNNTQYTQWKQAMKYFIRQLKFELTPSINESTSNYFQVTLESTPANKDGMGYEMKLMNGMGLFRFYQTGAMQFRLNPVLT